MELMDSKGRRFQISECDEALVQAFRWVGSHGGSSRRCYMVRSYDHVYLHRFLLGLKKGDPGVVDHINGDSLDNRRENLRIVDVSTNTLNRHVYKNRAGMPGVHAFRDRWTSRITIRGVKKHLGVFQSPEDAAAAYKAARVEAGIL